VEAHLPKDLVDRIYRALFVYSVGFYELVKKALEHSSGRYTVVTSIWKVFAILLEYCCRSDYRMLIQKISEEHKEAFDKQEAEYRARFEEQANKEKDLQKKVELLKVEAEELRKKWANEKGLRMKLETEFAEN